MSDYVTSQADINNTGKTETPKIRKWYNPSDDEKEAIRYVYFRKFQMESSPMRQKAMPMWDKSVDMWEALRKEKADDDWQSNHYVPLTQAAIETALSEFIGQTPRPFFTARGSEDQPRVKVANKIYDYSLEVSNYDLAEYDVFKEALTKGTAVAQEYYWQEKRIVQEAKSDETGKKIIFDDKEVTDYEDVYTELVRLEDFYVDEFARGFDGPFAARDCIRRYVMNIDDFRTQFSGPIWDPLENVKNGYVRPGGRSINFYEWYKPPQGIDLSKQVEVLWYWSVKPKDWLIIVANDVLILKKPIPFKHKKLPFSRAVAVKRLHSFYGKGICEILESTQDETNTMRRMILDRNHLDIDKMFLVSTRLSLSDEDLVARPHGMIPVDDVNGSKAIEYGDIPRSVEVSLQHLEDDATISTGINPRAEALPQSGTATEAAILKESTLKRLQLILWLFKYEFSLRDALLRMSNIIQFYSQPRLEEIVGEVGTQEYTDQVEKLKAEGKLVVQDGVKYKKSYREVPLKNQKFSTNSMGQPQLLPDKGNENFFEALPEFFVPLHKQQYRIQFQQGSFLQLSKPLMQSKMLELYDRVSQVALTVPNSYDIVKMTDKVIETYDIDPADLKPDQVNQGQEQEDQRLTMLLQLAVSENNQMFKGVEVPPTPYSSPAHTRIHLEAMNSQQFQNLPNNSQVIKIFTNHVTGELLAQQSRGQSGMPGQEPVPGDNQPQPQPGPAQPLAGQAQQGTVQTSVSQGMTNRPGGMNQPTSKLEEILPALQTGGNKNLAA